MHFGRIFAPLFAIFAAFWYHRGQVQSFEIKHVEIMFQTAGTFDHERPAQPKPKPGETITEETTKTPNPTPENPHEDTHLIMVIIVIGVVLIVFFAILIVLWACKSKSSTSQTSKKPVEEPKYQESEKLLEEPAERPEGTVQGKEAVDLPPIGIKPNYEVGYHRTKSYP